MHQIRPERTIEIPAIKQRMRGLVTIKRKDMRTGKYDLVREQKPNMVLNDFLNAFVGVTNKHNQRNMVSWGRYSSPTDGILQHCAIGSNGDAVIRTDNFIKTVLAISQSMNTDSEVGPVHQRSDYGVDPVWTERTWIFPAGTGTGTVREVGVRQSTLSIEIEHFARQVVSPEIVKSEYHQLEVTWRAEWSRGTEHPWSGVIAGGSKDGLTDINWAFEINNNQLMTWCNRANTSNIADTGRRNPIYRWNGRTANPQLVVGTSGNAGNLSEDSQYQLQGSELFAGTVPLWDTGNISRTVTAAGGEVAFRIGLDIQHANGNIGEIVFCSGPLKSTAQSYGGLGRLLLDPPLQKADNYRLFLDMKFQFDAS